MEGNYGAWIAIGGMMLMFILNKIFENNKAANSNVERKQGPDAADIYGHLLHLNTTVTKLDMGMEELIRMHQDTDSKFATVKVREELQALRGEINEEIEALRTAISKSEEKLEKAIKENGSRNQYQSNH